MNTFNKQSPEKWAAALTKRHGHQKASEIAHHEARPIYGNGEIASMNPNQGYFQHAFNWIKNRYQVKVYAQKQQTPKGRKEEQNVEATTQD